MKNISIWRSVKNGVLIIFACFLTFFVLTNIVCASILLEDKFDRTLDESWHVNFDNATSWIETTSENGLSVLDINPGDEGDWSIVTLSRDITPVYDFSAEFRMSWDSEDPSTGNQGMGAMQDLYLGLYDDTGALIVRVGFDDAWVGASGQQYASINTETFTSGYNSLPLAGAAIIQVSRSGGDVVVSWNGIEIASGSTNNPLKTVKLHFSYYEYVSSTQSSFFGTEKVELIRITDTPGTSLAVYSSDPPPGSEIVVDTILNVNGPVRQSGSAFISIINAGDNPLILTGAYRTVFTPVLKTAPWIDFEHQVTLGPGEFIKLKVICEMNTEPPQSVSNTLIISTQDSGSFTYPVTCRSYKEDVFEAAFLSLLNNVVYNPGASVIKSTFNSSSSVTCSDTATFSIDNSQPISITTILPDALGNEQIKLTDATGTVKVALSPSGDDPDLCSLQIESGAFTAPSVTLKSGASTGINTLTFTDASQSIGEYRLSTGEYAVTGRATIKNDLMPGGISISGSYSGTYNPATGTATAASDTRDFLNSLDVAAALGGAPSLGFAVEVTPAGSFTSSDTMFSGGVSVNGASAQHNPVVKQSDTISVSATATVDEEHIGQEADLLVVVSYTDVSTTQTYMKSQNGFKPWEWGNRSTLEASAVGVPLGTTVDIEVYQGTLPNLQPGTFVIYIGYRLNDGTIVFNQKGPIRFSLTSD